MPLDIEGPREELETKSTFLYKWGFWLLHNAELSKAFFLGTNIQAGHTLSQYQSNQSLSKFTCKISILFQTQIFRITQYEKVKSTKLYMRPGLNLNLWIQFI